MAELGLQLVTVLDHLRVDRVVGLGDGAGANIITRFAMNHPGRVHGVLTINNTATTSLGRFMERLQVKNTNTQSEKSLNKKNVAKFADAYKNRSEILQDLNKAKHIRLQVRAVPFSGGEVAICGGYGGD